MIDPLTRMPIENPNGVSKPVANYAALSSPQPAPQQQPGPWGENPTQAAWAGGVQGGNYGAPDDRFVGAFANAYANTPQPAPAPQPAMVPNAPPRQAAMQPRPMQAAPSPHDPNFGYVEPVTSSIHDPNHGAIPQSAPNADDRWAVQRFQEGLSPNDVGFGSGPIATSQNPKKSNKGKALAAALMNGPVAV